MINSLVNPTKVGGSLSGTLLYGDHLMNDILPESTLFQISEKIVFLKDPIRRNSGLDELKLINRNFPEFKIEIERIQDEIKNEYRNDR